MHIHVHAHTYTHPITWPFCAGALGDVVVRHSFAPTPLKPPVLAAGVAAMGSLHREWGLRIAQELALTFGR